MNLTNERNQAPVIRENVLGLHAVATVSMTSLSIFAIRINYVEYYIRLVYTSLLINCN